jgi:hypothetical protein
MDADRTTRMSLAASPARQNPASGVRPWQHTRGSALLGWVKDDAEYIADQIATLARAGGPPATAAAPPH